MNGTYNIVFELEFSDGVRWMFKVPIDGTVDDFKALNRKALTSEARTMQMLKTKTEIPVPAVYAFDASPRNDLGVPFIMMRRWQVSHYGWDGTASIWLGQTWNDFAHESFKELPRRWSS